MGVDKRKTAEVSYRPPNPHHESATWRTRKDSAACVSLSSIHIVKEPPKRRPKATPGTLDGTKCSIRSQRSGGVSPGDFPGASPASLIEVCCASTTKPQAKQFARATALRYIFLTIRSSTTGKENSRKFAPIPRKPNHVRRADAILPRIRA